VKRLILERVMKTQKDDVLHTSAHAQAQNAGNFGAASTETFGQRRSIDEQRKFVRGYYNSRIMNGHAGNAPRAKVFTPPAKD
jgi:hypothetical protein